MVLVYVPLLLMYVTYIVTNALYKRFSSKDVGMYVILKNISIIFCQLNNF